MNLVDIIKNLPVTYIAITILFCVGEQIGSGMQSCKVGEGYFLREPF
jgi:hypothetical protein